MADPTEAANGSEQDGDPTESSVIKELRAKAKRADAAEKAQVEMAQELAFFKSGLSDLSDDQRDDVLTIAKAKGDTSAEALKAIADRLSYSKTDTPTEGEPAAGEDRSAELAQLANLARSPANTEPAPAGAALDKEIREFKGDFQAFEQFVMSHADDIVR